MNENTNIYEQIEKYCLDLMDEKECYYFEQEIAKNPALAKSVHEYQILLHSFDHQQSRQFIHDSLSTFHHQHRSHTVVLLTQLKLHVNKYWRTASVAACVALIASVFTFITVRSIYKQDTKGVYETLRLVSKEINSIKKNQGDIKNEVGNLKKKSAAIPDYPSKYSGTGFALNNSGYLVTNLHVIDGFSKIFVFTNDNVGHPSEVVATDEINDLAILKINESDFSFHDKVPYSIRKSNPNIAQRIYSLGYPKNDIVYNEGYISSTTGFEGDSNRFQLELPSGPGVSGAPILDESGNVVGIISGKQSQTEGITFAIKTQSLLSLCKSLPHDFESNGINISEIKGQTRAQQVKKIQPYICVVKVYN